MIQFCQLKTKDMKEVPQFEIRMHRVDVSKTIFIF